MVSKFVLLVIFIFHIVCAPAFAEEKLVEQEKTLNVANICGAEITFTAPYQHNESNYKVSDVIQVNIVQYLSSKGLYGAELATNVQCQSLTGAKYTGSKQEWKNYFKNTGMALTQKGAKNLQLTIAGTETKAYQGKLPNREYKFSGDFNEGAQVIFNLAILDIKSNRMYSISVSGSYKIEKYILGEFNRIVTSFNLL